MRVKTHNLALRAVPAPSILDPCCLYTPLPGETVGNRMSSTYIHTHIHEALGEHSNNQSPKLLSVASLPTENWSYRKRCRLEERAAKSRSGKIQNCWFVGRRMPITASRGSTRFLFPLGTCVPLFLLPSAEARTLSFRPRTATVVESETKRERPAHSSSSWFSSAGTTEQCATGVEEATGCGAYESGARDEAGLEEI